MDSSHGCTMEMYLISVNCTLRNGKDGIFVQLKKNFMSYLFYLNVNFPIFISKHLHFI